MVEFSEKYECLIEQSVRVECSIEHSAQTECSTSIIQVCLATLSPRAHLISGTAPALTLSVASLLHDSGNTLPAKTLLMRGHAA